MNYFYTLIQVRGSMGPNTPKKFSAAKLFGFGGNSKKSSDSMPMASPSGSADAIHQQSNFNNSFSTQPIKIEDKFDSFKVIKL